ncbi:hypothetical protein WHR41_00387 [Cladosporium halotolerans]|uniref:Uncharacterized protein n=1 Tax=Cladosporium halotolerans TaxID=1052096 RepID=A0AB34L667_9PEZI
MGKHKIPRQQPADQEVSRPVYTRYPSSEPQQRRERAIKYQNEALDHMVNLKLPPQTAAIAPAVAENCLICNTRAKRKRMTLLENAPWVDSPEVEASNKASRERAACKSSGKRGDASTTELVDLTGDEPPSKAPRHKKAKGDLEKSYDASQTPAEKGKGSHAGRDAGKQRGKPKQAKDGERRLRRWRSHPPSTYLEVRDRALTQRMFALDRQRSCSDAEHPIETVSLAGTTGNVYTITIDKVPSCDCPHAKKGNQCKHIAYVLSRVLRAPQHLEYQLAFISSELREIFENAPPLPSETAENAVKDGNRKPIEGDCPICCVDFEPDNREEIVYCKASCGNNIHKECFSQWAATKRGQNVTCPFCRAPWQGDEEQLKQVAKSGAKNSEGYVNVASQLGLSGRRDYSTYHAHWVRGQVRRGRISWDEDGVMDHEY